MKKIWIITALASLTLGLSLYLWYPAEPMPEAVGQAQGAEIVLYTGKNFTGRTLRVLGTVYDLPVEEEPDGSVFNWNDKVQSLIVVAGTWRLYENGRLNTRLDDTEIENFDVRTKLPAGGWSSLISATSAGALEVPDLPAGGLGDDISSLELVSEANLPDWALVFRKP